MCEKHILSFCLKRRKKSKKGEDSNYYVGGGAPMARYVIKRIVYMVITLFIIATVTFFLMKLL
ncbi:ABC transporter permease, partial [Parageobacillus toebii]|nr:ABC transporter permease [Parageobacillus toebii]